MSDTQDTIVQERPLQTEGKKPSEMVNLVGLSREELIETVTGFGLPKFRAGQIWHWIYHRGAKSFDEMTTLSKSVRAELAKICVIGRPDIVEEQLSQDKTRKWLLGVAGGGEVETVYIPETDRGALCISSQVGCALSCKFCHTGTQPLVRNLSAADIVGQMLVARDTYGEWPSPRGSRQLSNIVMMGMGEPLLNFDNVSKAITIIMDQEGISISKRRITLSTAGYVPNIERCGEELGVNLAVSLHAVRDDLRDEIVPINQKFPIKDLLDACRRYPTAGNSRRITFEYVMLRGVNDSELDARELVRLIAGIPAKVNLIPFNAWPGAPFECSDDAAIEKFARIVNDAGYSSPVRTPRGRDILAACGQLKSASERAKRRTTA
ncbi:MAG: 23S rRNA (adenine(2503)-C(2))-methyltransferase RlmN [Rhodospirillaceae bacterium]|nr:23S rRNA (adenine(2503)-C(2))-methyltransferase RlmN [Rhodospirillaceae bacterium]|tara:strand:- start:12416 stop:13552 length:1137 start_codon:yes stop_codon:yes gene_type:complete